MIQNYNEYLVKQANFCSHKKTAQMRIYLKSFEDLNYLKFIDININAFFFSIYLYP